MKFLNHIRNRKLTADVLSDMCRQTGAMVGTGITMAKTMEILKNTTESKKLSGIYGELEYRIKQGQSIGDSMDAIGIFPELMVNMFRAAEISGRLEKTANHLAEHYRKEHRTMTQIKAATTYPKILCVMAITIVLFVFLVIMPMVEPLFQGVELPLTTQALMRIGLFLQQDWYVAALVFLIVVFLGPRVLAFHPVKRNLNKMSLFVPVFGKQMRIIYTARFARSLSSLYASGVPMLVSLVTASRTLGNRYLEEQFSNVVLAVEQGETLSEAVGSIKGLDKKLPAIIFVGEETGKLDTMLLSLAEGYEHEAEVAMNKMVSMTEPMMIVAIGLVVAVILLGIMLPMWSMYEYLG